MSSPQSGSVSPSTVSLTNTDANISSITSGPDATSQTTTAPASEPAAYNIIACTNDANSWIMTGRTQSVLNKPLPGVDRRLCYNSPNVTNTAPMVGSAYVEATKRNISVPSVPETAMKTFTGIQQLMRDGHLRTAIDVCAQMLADCGQGAARAHQSTRHSTHSMQLWTLRLQLQLAVGFRQQVSAELDTFSDLDAPDLRHEYYPELGAKTGSLVPFSLRVIHAESPSYEDRYAEAIGRFTQLIRNLEQIMYRVSSGRCISHGTHQVVGTDTDSVRLWSRRLNMAKQAMANLAASYKEHDTYMHIYDSMASLSPEQLSAAGCACIQTGAFQRAAQCFARFNAVCDQTSAKMKSLACMHKGFTNVFYGSHAEALRSFQAAAQFDASNHQAINNVAVCQLYMGDLTSANQTLQSIGVGDQRRVLTESLCTNLCTLYELNTAKNEPWKLALLGTCVQTNGDAFNVAAFKLS